MFCYFCCPTGGGGRKSNNALERPHMTGERRRRRRPDVPVGRIKSGAAVTIIQPPAVQQRAEVRERRGRRVFTGPDWLQNNIKTAIVVPKCVGKIFIITVVVRFVCHGGEFGFVYGDMQTNGPTQLQWILFDSAAHYRRLVDIKCLVFLCVYCGTSAYAANEERAA